MPNQTQIERLAGALARVREQALAHAPAAGAALVSELDRTTDADRQAMLAALHAAQARALSR